MRLGGLAHLLGPGSVVVAPTEAEALRVKAFLVVQRNVVRDFLDVEAYRRRDGIGVVPAALLTA